MCFIHRECVIRSHHKHDHHHPIITHIYYPYVSRRKWSSLIRALYPLNSLNLARNSFPITLNHPTLLIGLMNLWVLSLSSTKPKLVRGLTVVAPIWCRRCSMEESLSLAILRRNCSLSDISFDCYSYDVALMLPDHSLFLLFKQLTKTL